MIRAGEPALGLIMEAAFKSIDRLLWHIEFAIDMNIMIIVRVNLQCRL